MTMIQEIKKVHTYDVVLVKIGQFFHAYGKDAYIVSYLMEYKLSVKDNIYTVGFPTKIINKVMSKLENEKINYIILDRQNNYDVEEKSDNKNLNKYQETYEKAKEYINIKNRVNKICKYLENNMLKKECKEKIRKIEEIIQDEGRKI